MEGEEEEDDKDETQDGEDHDAHGEVDCLKWSHSVVRTVRDGGGLL